MAVEELGERRAPGGEVGGRQPAGAGVVVGQRIPLSRDRTDDPDPTAINRPSGRGAEVGVGQSRTKDAFHDGRGFALRLDCGTHGAIRRGAETATFEVPRGAPHDEWVVAELAEGGVAPEAQQPADLVRLVVMVDVDGRPVWQMAQTPCCTSSIASRSPTVMPYEFLR
jgi:hypothetical protein